MFSGGRGASPDKEASDAEDLRTDEQSCRNRSHPETVENVKEASAHEEVGDWGLALQGINHRGRRRILFSLLTHCSDQVATLDPAELLISFEDRRAD